MTDMKILDLPALSIRQPWAEKIVAEGKDIENRSWPTNRRGWFWVHASKTYEGGMTAMKEEYGTSNIPLGALVGIAKITGCVTASSSPWFNGPYGFVLTAPHRLRHPIACRGQLGWFSVAHLKPVSDSRIMLTLEQAEAHIIAVDGRRP